MGITGLIPFLEKASAKFHIRQAKGQCVAIDTYCWLHKGAFACADKLARGEETDIHIQYCLKYVNMLLSHGIKPILVFDGRHLPAKANTELKRRENRQSSKKKAAELLRLGKIDEARSHLRRCVDITHEMALQLIQECRKKNVDCIVAPYEADAQMAYLNRKGIAQFVITEDSDLVLFGCNKILFKLDLMGNCLFVEADKLYLAMGCKEEKYTFEKFRRMCILSGCDYLDSLPGIGLAKACKFILKTEEQNINRALAKIPAYLNMRHLVVTEEYKTDFAKAEATFQHMIVYDPILRKLARLSDPQDTGTPEEMCSNAGEFFEEDVAFHLALGNLNPFTLKRLDNWTPDSQIVKGNSIWMPSYKAPLVVKKSIQTPVKKVMSKKKDQIISPELLFDDDSQSSDIGKNILASYLTDKKQEEISPTAKRKFNEIDKTPKKSKNPFALSATAKEERILMSPTKLTPANTSLIKNFSPVKKIQYRKTFLSNEKKVVSRFFGSTQLENDQEEQIDERMLKYENPMIPSDPPKTENTEETHEESIMKILNPKDDEETQKYNEFIKFFNSPEAKMPDRGETTPTKNQPILDEARTTITKPVFNLDSGISSDASPKDNDDEASTSISQVSKSFSLESFKYSPKKIADKNTPMDDENDVIEIVDSPVAKMVKLKESPVRKIMTANAEQKVSPATKLVKKPIRRIGLSKGKSSGGPGAVGQTKLSMFGFQKKAQI